MHKSLMMAGAFALVCGTLAAPIVPALGADVVVVNNDAYDFIGMKLGASEHGVIMARKPVIPHDPWQGIYKQMLGDPGSEHIKKLGDGGSAIITATMFPDNEEGRMLNVGPEGGNSRSSIANQVAAGNFPAASPPAIKRLMMAPEYLL